MPRCASLSAASPCGRSGRRSAPRLLRPSRGAAEREELRQGARHHAWGRFPRHRRGRDQPGGFEAFRFAVFGDPSATYRGAVQTGRAPCRAQRHARRRRAYSLPTTRGAAPMPAIPWAMCTQSTGIWIATMAVGSAVAPVPADRRNEGCPPPFVPCGSLRALGPGEPRCDDPIPARGLPCHLHPTASGAEEVKSAPEVLSRWLLSDYFRKIHFRSLRSRLLTH